MAGGHCQAASRLLVIHHMTDDQASPNPGIRTCSYSMRDQQPHDSMGPTRQASLGLAFEVPKNSAPRRLSMRMKQTKVHKAVARSMVVRSRTHADTCCQQGTQLGSGAPGHRQVAAAIVINKAPGTVTCTTSTSAFGPVPDAAIVHSTPRTQQAPSYKTAC